MKKLLLSLFLLLPSSAMAGPNQCNANKYLNAESATFSGDLKGNDLVINSDDKLILDGDFTSNDYISAASDGSIRFYLGGSQSLRLLDGTSWFSSHIHMTEADNRIYNSAGPQCMHDTACAATGHALGAGDWIFDGITEFNQVSYHDQGVFMSLYLSITDNARLQFGSGGDGGMMYNVGHTPDALFLGVGQDNRTLIIGEWTDRDTDLGVAQATNPTVHIHSADITDSTKHLDLFHDGTNGVIEPGTGGVKLLSSNGKGSASYIQTKTESVTFAGDPGDASKVTTGSIIPAGAFVIGVSSRVTTVATNCTSVDIGIAAKDTDAFADGTAVAAETTTTTADGEPGARYDNAGGLGIIPSMVAQEITVTAVGGNCFDGVWAITVHYMDISAATSN